MKNHALHFALAYGLLVCGSYTAMAQLLSSSAPIIINLSEIDRYSVDERSLPKVMDGARLGLPYRDMMQSEVETLVRDGTMLNREVWIMDGQRIIAKCSLIGEFIYQNDSKPKDEYGLYLGVDSAEEAQRIGAVLKLEPSLDELILQHKRQLNNQRFWIP